MHGAPLPISGAARAEVDMQKAAHFCGWPGCNNVTADKYCEQHCEEGEAMDRRKKLERLRKYDGRRGSARQRGYDARWDRYSKWFLSRPGNQLCALRLDDGCAIVSQCVDHIEPPRGADDPKFWDTANHQPSCIHCNSVKGHKKLKGEYWEHGQPNSDERGCGSDSVQKQPAEE